MKTRIWAFLGVLGLLTLSGCDLYHPRMLSGVKNALTPPSTYEYSYNLNADLRWQVTQYDSYGDPTENDYLYYTRTSDGAYYNYSSVMLYPSGSDLLPFSVTISFNRSNTAWTYTGYGGGKYFPTDGVSAIGSDAAVGTIAKEIFTFNNTSTHDYFISVDISSSTQSYWTYTLNSNILVNSGIFTSVSGLNTFVLPMGYILVMSKDATATAQYLSAFYLKDLGVSPAYTSGASSGYDIGYDDGYDVGLEDGLFEGYGDGYDDGYDDGLYIGSSVGYIDGFADGQQETEVGGPLGQAFLVIKGAFGVVGDVLSVEIIPGVTIGLLISIPLVLGLLFWLVSFFTGKANR